MKITEEMRDTICVLDMGIDDTECLCLGEMYVKEKCDRCWKKNEQEILSK